MNNLYGDLFDDATADATIPPRSRLYHLPLADGAVAGDHESMLSYLHRLAHRHQVTVKNLMVKVVLPETAIRGVPCSYRFTSEYARSINGYGKYATELHDALSRLTMVQRLDRSNFLPWGALFNPSGAGLLHLKRRWCPSCIADYSATSADGHAHPLLWACASITHCPIHSALLVDTCLKCDAPQAQISERFSYGRCDRCGTSLGWRAGLLEGDRLSDRQAFVTRAVRQMIAANADVADIAKPENFASGLRHIAKQTHSGVITHLARAIRVDYKVMSNWINLEYRPRFDSFIETCYRLGTMPIDLLRSADQTLKPQLRPGSEPLKRAFHKLTEAQLLEAKKEISTLLLSNDYVSAKQFAASIGTSVGHLRYQIPLEYRALVEHALRVKAAATDRKRVENLALARSVAHELAQQGLHVPLRKLASALEAKGLHIHSPPIRKASKEELRKLRNAWRQSPTPIRDSIAPSSDSNDRSPEAPNDVTFTR